MDSKKLTEEFAKFIGKEIKNPKRLTTDICDVAQEISNFASQYGALVMFHDVASEPDPLAFMVDAVALHVYIEKQDNSALWKIKRMNLN